jgi:uncharacterized protein (DUF433 family)
MPDHDQRLFEARYDIAAAAHHLGMPRSTLSSWLSGMGNFRPVLTPPRPGYLSFINLTEAFVLVALRRRYRIKMPNIRDAIAYAERELQVDHPLAFQEFTTDYVDLFVRTAGGVVNASRGGQTKLDGVLSELSRIEWRDKRPIALFPVPGHGQDADARPIRISPLVAFGRPVLTGTRIPISAVADRFYSGESIGDLADDYEVPLSAVEEAVRVEREPAAA